MTEATELKKQIRVEKLAAMFKQRLMQFPVLSRGDVRGMFRTYNDSEIDGAVDLLLKGGFITIAEGTRGGVRYVRVPGVKP